MFVNNYFDMEQTKFEKTVESNTNMEYEMPAGMNGCCMNQCLFQCSGREIQSILCVQKGGPADTA